MKTTLLLISAALFLTSPLKSQNIFSNPDFELYSSCPVTQDEVNKAIDWVSIIQSPDYMNCNYIGWTGQTITGAQSGSGYMGFASYGSPGATEAIAQQLTTPLVTGNTYNISLYAKKTTGPGYAMLCGGVCFYGFTGDPFNGMPGVGMCPEDSGATVLACTDSVNSTLWELYSVSFVAAANYDFIGMAAVCPTGNCGEYIFVDNLHFILSSVGENQLNIEGVKVFQAKQKNYLDVSFNLMKNSRVKFSFFNAFGENILTSQKKLTTGHIYEQFDITNIATGVYFFRIESDSFSMVKEVFISK